MAIAWRNAWSQFAMDTLLLNANNVADFLLEYIWQNIFKGNYLPLLFSASTNVILEWGNSLNSSRYFQFYDKTGYCTTGHAIQCQF